MPLYDAHLCLQRPADDALLWRFMDLARFIAMLQSHQIFLCPITQFEDKHEGLYHPEAYTILDDPEIRKRLESLGTDSWFLKECIQGSTRWRERLSACCFHQGSSDSEFLWKIYSDASYGIACTMTVGELLQSLEGNDQYYALASVYYSDLILDPLFQYDSEYMPGLVKRPQFRYEQEVRLLHSADEVNPRGTYLNIDIRRFFRNVIVSPYAPPWFMESIKGILNLLNIEATVQKSGLFLPHAIFRSQ